MLLLLSLPVLPALAQHPDERERPRLDEGGGASPSASRQQVQSPEDRLPPISPDNTLQLRMVQGIRVQDDPNGRHDHQSPAFAQTCDGDDALPCAWILWEMHYGFPVTGARYLASVPRRVPLKSGDAELSWIPSVHCITWDTRRRARYKVSSGPHCMNIVDAETQQMEWHVGGVLEGDPEPGMYEGWIPVSFTTDDRHWIVDVPITYERFRQEPTCTLNAGGNPTVTGLPYPYQETSSDPAPGGGIKITPSSSTRTTLELSGTWGSIDACGADGSLAGPTNAACPGPISATTGWARIRPTPGLGWSFSISRVTFSGHSVEGGGTPGDDADWKWIVGYYRGGQPFHIETDEAIAFTESAGVWMDANGWGHIYLGGELEVPASWPAFYADGRTFQETAVVSFTCGG